MDDVITAAEKLPRLLMRLTWKGIPELAEDSEENEEDTNDAPWR